MKIWFAVIDDRIWIGSLDANRAWVKNVTANGRARLDFGSGSVECHLEPVEEVAAVERFARAIRRRHPILAPVLALLVRGRRRVFATRERASELLQAFRASSNSA